MVFETELDHLHRFLNTLAMAPRAVFILHRVDVLTFDQIAWRLGLSLDAVEQHFADAVRHLIFGDDQPG